MGHCWEGDCGHNLPQSVHSCARPACNRGTSGGDGGTSLHTWSAVWIDVPASGSCLELCLSPCATTQYTHMHTRRWLSRQFPGPYLLWEGAVADGACPHTCLFPLPRWLCWQGTTWLWGTYTWCSTPLHTTAWHGIWSITVYSPQLAQMWVVDVCAGYLATVNSAELLCHCASESLGVLVNN